MFHWFLCDLNSLPQWVCFSEKNTGNRTALLLYKRSILGCVPLALPVFVQPTWYKINTGKASGTPNFR
jgi:hypothetical protein